MAVDVGQAVTFQVPLPLLEVCTSLPTDHMLQMQGFADADCCQALDISVEKSQNALSLTLKAGARTRLLEVVEGEYRCTVSSVVVPEVSVFKPISKVTVAERECVLASPIQLKRPPATEQGERKRRLAKDNRRPRKVKVKRRKTGKGMVPVRDNEDTGLASDQIEDSEDEDKKVSVSNAEKEPCERNPEGRMDSEDGGSVLNLSEEEIHKILKMGPGLPVNSGSEGVPSTRRMREFKCLICGKVIRNAKKILLQHVKYIHNVDRDDYLHLFSLDPDQALEQIRMMAVEGLKFTEAKSRRSQVGKGRSCSTPCPVCKRVFFSHTYLLTHIKRVHKNNCTVDRHISSIERNVKVSEQRRKTPGRQRKNHKRGPNSQIGDSAETDVCHMCDRAVSDMKKHIREMHHIDMSGDSSDITLVDVLDIGGQDQGNVKKSPDVQNVTKKEGNGEETEEKIACPICFKGYKQSTNMLHHVQRLHEGHSRFKEVLYELDEKFFNLDKLRRSPVWLDCFYCGVKRRGYNMVHHLNCCHYMEPDIKDVIEDTKNRSEQEQGRQKRLRDKKLAKSQMEEGFVHKCRHCDKTYPHRASRCRHERFFCTKNPQRVQSYKCNCCSFHSSDKEKLRKHKLEHGQGPNFVCHMCGKQYVSRSSLLVHRRKEHGIAVKYEIKYHECQVCGKKFYQHFQFERHRYKHVEERTCQCEMCGKSFKSSIDVKKHQRSVHQNVYRYYCDKCGHGVMKLSYLRAHQCGRVRRVQPQEAQVATKVIRGHVKVVSEHLHEDVAMPYTEPFETRQPQQQQLPMGAPDEQNQVIVSTMSQVSVPPAPDMLHYTTVDTVQVTDQVVHQVTDQVVHQVTDQVVHQVTDPLIHQLPGIEEGGSRVAAGREVSDHGALAQTSAMAPASDEAPLITRLLSQAPVMPQAVDQAPQATQAQLTTPACSMTPAPAPLMIPVPVMTQDQSTPLTHAQQTWLEGYTSPMYVAVQVASSDPHQMQYGNANNPPAQNPATNYQS